MKEKIKEGIEQSKFFFVIGSENYFKDTEALEQAEYAKKLKKPFRILLQRGVYLPDNFLKGVENIKIRETDLNNKNEAILMCHELLKEEIDAISSRRDNSQK